MNRTDFDAIVDAAVQRTATLLVQKGAEYAGDADRLVNFKRNAAKNGQTVLETWQTYWGKHIDAINSYMARVKDEAVMLALEEVVEHAARLKAAGGSMREAVDPARFREIVNNAIPYAMRKVETELSEPIEGRFDDNINYSFLCMAILQELRNPPSGPVGDSRP